MDKIRGFQEFSGEYMEGMAWKGRAEAYFDTFYWVLSSLLLVSG